MMYKSRVRSISKLYVDLFCSYDDYIPVQTFGITAGFTPFANLAEVKVLVVRYSINQNSVAAIKDETCSAYLAYSRLKRVKDLATLNFD